MKILVLRHSAWIEMLIHSWQLLDDVEVLSLDLPVTQWDALPELRMKVADAIIRGVERHKVDFVLDINAAGVLPLDETLSAWTTSRAGVPWCVWWWNDPISYVAEKLGCKQLSEWTDALSHRSVRHFIWDATLAHEYSNWFGTPWKHLPTATNVGFFHPDAAKLSARTFPFFDLTFLGTFYPRSSAPISCHPEEVDFLADRRHANPASNLLEVADEEMSSGRAEHFLEDLRTARLSRHGVFSETLVGWKCAVNHAMAIRRRTAPLEAMASALGGQHLFAGDDWPSSFKPELSKIFQPAELSTLYQAAMFNLDLGGEQAYTGTAMRSYEIMACGGVLALPGLPEFDPAGEFRDVAYITYSSAEDLAVLREHYGNNPRRLAVIRSNAREFAASRHSWIHRLQPMLEHLATRQHRAESS